jgi:hypothetical protein
LRLYLCLRLASTTINESLIYRFVELGWIYLDAIRDVSIAKVPIFQLVQHGKRRNKQAQKFKSKEVRRSLFQGLISKTGSSGASLVGEEKESRHDTRYIISYEGKIFNIL